MIGADRLLVDLECALKERLGFGVIGNRAIQFRQLVKGCAGVWMFHRQTCSFAKAVSMCCQSGPTQEVVTPQRNRLPNSLGADGLLYLDR